MDGDEQDDGALPLGRNASTSDLQPPVREPQTGANANLESGHRDSAELGANPQSMLLSPGSSKLGNGILPSLGRSRGVRSSTLVPPNLMATVSLQGVPSPLEPSEPEAMTGRSRNRMTRNEAPIRPSPIRPLPASRGSSAESQPSQNLLAESSESSMPVTRITMSLDSSQVRPEYSISDSSSSIAGRRSNSSNLRETVKIPDLRSSLMVGDSSSDQIVSPSTRSSPRRSPRRSPATHSPTRLRTSTVVPNLSAAMLDIGNSSEPIFEPSSKLGTSDVITRRVTNNAHASIAAATMSGELTREERRRLKESMHNTPSRSLSYTPSVGSERDRRTTTPSTSPRTPVSLRSSTIVPNLAASVSGPQLSAGPEGPDHSRRTEAPTASSRTPRSVRSSTVFPNLAASISGPVLTSVEPDSSDLIDVTSRHSSSYVPIIEGDEEHDDETITSFSVDPAADVPDPNGWYSRKGTSRISHSSRDQSNANLAARYSAAGFALDERSSYDPRAAFEKDQNTRQRGRNTSDATDITRKSRITIRRQGQPEDDDILEARGQAAALVVGGEKGEKLSRRMRQSARLGAVSVGPLSDSGTVGTRDDQIKARELAVAMSNSVTQTPGALSILDGSTASFLPYSSGTNLFSRPDVEGSSPTDEADRRHAQPSNALENGEFRPGPNGGMNSEPKSSEVARTGCCTTRRILVLIAAFVIIGAGTGTAIALAGGGGGGDGGGGGGNPSSDQAPTPSPVQSLDPYREFLEPIVKSPNVLLDSESPQYNALQWLVRTDGAGIPGNDDAVKEFQVRFVLVTFVFSNHPTTSELIPGASKCSWEFVECDPSSASVVGIVAERKALRGDLSAELAYLSPTLASLKFSTNRLENIDVVYNLTSLAALDLSDNHLSDVISSKLGNLVQLTSLKLTSNGLSGTMATELNNLSKLEILDLSTNGLEGDFGSLFAGLNSLVSLSVKENRFTGTMDSVGSMQQLEFFDVTTNELGGTLPTELGSLTKLSLTSFGFNRFTGTLPTELEQLTALTYFASDGNGITGAFFPGIGKLSELRNLIVSDLTGELPTEIFSRLQNLLFFSGHRSFSGTLPTELGLATQMTHLVLSDSQMSSTLPSELGALSGLKILELDGVDLSGSLPSELANLSLLQILDIEDTDIVGVVPEPLCESLTLLLVPCDQVDCSACSACTC